MGRSWTSLQKTTVLAVGTAIVSAAATLDAKQDLHLKAVPFVMLGIHPSLPIPPLNDSMGSVELDYSRPFHSAKSSSFSMDSSMNTMLSVCTDKAAAISQFNHSRNVNCNFSPMFQKLGYSHASKFWSKMSYLDSKSSIFCPEKASFNPKSALFGPKTTYFCLYLAASSRFCSCLEFLSNNSIKAYIDFPQTLRRANLNSFSPCLYSTRQFQAQGLRQLQALNVPLFELRFRTNAISYLKTSSLYSFHIDSSHSFSSSKVSPLASIFSSLISPSLFSSVSTKPFSSPYATDSRSFHVWRSPGVDGDGNEDKSFCSERKPVMAVVLLGWLGAEQKHLKKYADWYTTRGIHAVTFVVPMKDLLSFKPGGRVEQHIEVLATELASWLSEKENDGRERCIMFHTFSNTGWLTYGLILEKLLKTGYMYEKIKGCIIDSAPEPEPNPQVWALGFSAAFLKKRSALLHSALESSEERFEMKGANGKIRQQLEPPFTEAALLAILEKFFSVMLKLPYINERLSEVTSILSNNQPPCPQLYIYSSADRVIPAQSVESFIEEQKKAGKKVRACNLKSSPHVDHFRSFPNIYTEQLHNFLEECTQVIGR